MKRHNYRAFFVNFKGHAPTGIQDLFIHYFWLGVFLCALFSLCPQVLKSAETDIDDFDSVSDFAELKPICDQIIQSKGDARIVKFGRPNRTERLELEVSVVGSKNERLSFPWKEVPGPLSIAEKDQINLLVNAKTTLPVRLRISRKRLTKADFEAIALCKSTLFLDLNCCWLEPDCFSGLATRNIPVAVCIEGLFSRKTQEDELHMDVTDALAAGVGSAKCISSISLKNTQFSDTGIESLLEMKSLKHLSIEDGENLNGYERRKLPENLKGACFANAPEIHLSSLHLNGVQLSSKSLIALAKSKVETLKLRDVYVDGHPITDEDLLLPQQWPNLKHFSSHVRYFLEHNFVDGIREKYPNQLEPTDEELEDRLPEHKYRVSQLLEDQPQVLGKFVLAMPNLLTLCFDRKYAFDTKELKCYVENCQKLDYLQISTQRGDRHLAESLSKMPNLKRLYLTNCQKDVLLSLQGKLKVTSLGLTAGGSEGIKLASTISGLKELAFKRLGGLDAKDFESLGVNANLEIISLGGALAEGQNRQLKKMPRLRTVFLGSWPDGFYGDNEQYRQLVKSLPEYKLSRYDSDVLHYEAPEEIRLDQISQYPVFVPQ